MIISLDKKVIRILLIITIILLTSFSIGYAALNQRLNISGDISLLPSETGISITSCTASLKNNATETSSPSYTGTSASLGVSLPKTNSNVVYTVTVKNNGTTSARYSGVTATSSNDAISYVISGINTATIIEAGEEKTFTLTISYTSSYKYNLPSTTSSSMTFEFEFINTTNDSMKNLTGSITPESGDVTSTSLGALFTLTVSNPNDYPVEYTLSGANNFLVTDESGNTITKAIVANGTDTYNIYVKDQDNSIATGTTANVSIIASSTFYDETVTSTLATVTLTLEDKSKYKILADGFSDATDLDFSKVDTTSSGVFVTEDSNGDKTYYFRGTVSNNYFSFAGFTWRILRIDSNGNVRLVLNSLITNSGSVSTQVFKSSYTATSQTAADTLAKMVNDKTDSSVNSPLYGSTTSTDSTNLRGWYNNNLASYESYIVDSTFCQDTSGGTATSSGTSASVFYYASYQKLGKDTSLYEPDLSCDSEYAFTDKIGTISADEYVFAGGSYNSTTSTSMFLNDSGISTRYWTLSPAYYDPDQDKVGVFVVTSSGTLTDWENGNTITNAGGMRPVITVNGNLIVTGTGTSTDPYTFAS